MTEKQAKKVYDKYNNKNLVVRCPHGKSTQRELLNQFVMSAVNLYGVILIDEFVDLFNHYNPDFKTTSDEVHKLLMTLVLKNKNYCFYKDYLVTYLAIDDFDFADKCIDLQGDKPRYIPSRNEFIKYAVVSFKVFTNSKYWDKVLDFMMTKWPNDFNAMNFYFEAATLYAYTLHDINVAKLIETSGLEFDSFETVSELIYLITDAGNNTRLFENKGYTPSELVNIYKDEKVNESTNFDYSLPKISVNDPCYCGSGKKYKKCCLLIEKSKSSYLSFDEKKLFYETWYGLLGYVNETHKVISQKIEAKYPNKLNDEQVFSVREVLWTRPSLIKDYYNQANLPQDKVELLKSWEKYYKVGSFMIIGYTKDYAILSSDEENGKSITIGLVGISRSISDLIHSRLPVSISTVLLPFNDRIIYDGYMHRMSIDFGDGIKKVFDDEFNSIKKEEIITKFE